MRPRRLEIGPPPLDLLERNRPRVEELLGSVEGVLSVYELGTGGAHVTLSLGYLVRVNLDEHVAPAHHVAGQYVHGDHTALDDGPDDRLRGIRWLHRTWNLGLAADDPGGYHLGADLRGTDLRIRQSDNVRLRGRAPVCRLLTRTAGREQAQHQGGERRSGLHGASTKGSRQITDAGAARPSRRSTWSRASHHSACHVW